ncbi:MAG: hypothetical protein HYX89_08475 [Chloroflexi bacterium]|nr:hypothetical protein [Chloroflexota bacterium]
MAHFLARAVLAVILLVILSWLALRIAGLILWTVVPFLWGFGAGFVTAALLFFGLRWRE